ncbi:AAA family ATPase [uncultured Treponema sp.]|uniref:AAA family ATPase n=1 Tax=uncultured Treponema sp. TaxID=162155 RepID=UPI0025958656|nr:AAA family ATPase [uncultured Treponema sp.]
MQRKLISDLIEWKNKTHRKPLMLMGARQVGKTWLMKEFGKKEFKKTAYVTFFNNNRMKNVFETDYDIERILLNINAETKISVTPGDTLIKLRYLVNTKFLQV